MLLCPVHKCCINMNIKHLCTMHSPASFLAQWSYFCTLLSLKAHCLSGFEPPEPRVEQAETAKASTPSSERFTQEKPPPHYDTRAISINPGPFFTTHISDGRRRGRWGPRWWWRTRIWLQWGRFPERSSGTSYPVWNEWSRSFWTVVLQLDALGLLTHLGTRGGQQVEHMSYF